eukprot:4986-Heterococcus_DN1.PRE.1
MNTLQPVSGSRSWMQDLGMGAVGEGSDGGVTGSAAGSTPSFKHDVVRARARVSRFGCCCHAQTIYGSNPSSNATTARMMLLLQRENTPKLQNCASSKMADQEDMELDNMLAEGHADFEDNNCMQDEDDDTELQGAPTVPAIAWKTAKLTHSSNKRRAEALTHNMAGLQ